MRSGFVILVVVLLLLLPEVEASGLGKLRIGPNHRFLVKANGSPFVWIGDTHWFFARLPPATIDRLLDRRRSQGFTVVAVSCRENLSNGGGPGRIDDPNEAWWSYLDEFVDKCERRNLYVAVTLEWWGVAIRNDASTLFEYGRWVGDRYKDRDNIVWLTLGEAGSHRRKQTIPREKIAALVNGIRTGDTGNKLLSIHADYGRGTSLSADGDLCDFNNWQTGQGCCVDDLPRADDRLWTVWEAMEFDREQRYGGQPKPTLDTEAWYENNKDFCGATPFVVRRRAYFTIFAGAFGHTYGAGGIWDGLSTGQGCSGSALEALEYPGAEHMGHLSRLLHGLGEDLLKLRPDQSLILEGNSDAYESHIQALVSRDDVLALIYSAGDDPYRVDLTRFAPDRVEAAWFNPRTGGGYPTEGPAILETSRAREVDPPGARGADHDWVLVLKVSGR